jgi:hypothetical protein
MGRLRTMAIADDGTITLETGWTSEERQGHGLTEEEARDIKTSAWTRSPRGVWTKK